MRALRESRTTSPLEGRLTFLATGDTPGLGIDAVAPTAGLGRVEVLTAREAPFGLVPGVVVGGDVPTSNPGDAPGGGAGELAGSVTSEGLGVGKIPVGFGGGGVAIATVGVSFAAGGSPSPCRGVPDPRLAMTSATTNSRTKHKAPTPAPQTTQGFRAASEEGSAGV